MMKICFDRKHKKVYSITVRCMRLLQDFKDEFSIS